MNRSHARRQGFTLMEVLLVLAILVILGSMAVVMVSSAQKKANLDAARGQVGLFDSALERYHLDMNEYPSSLSALRFAPADARNTTRWAGPYLDRDVPKDPWDNEYQYVTPGNHNPDKYDIWTIGPDGQEIGNWTNGG